MRRPAILPVPGFALRLALQERAAMLLEGQRVTPRKLLDAGLRFAYADIDSAVKQLAA
jgi:NAD dependent epimerase/dehydratase family enzyme